MSKNTPKSGIDLTGFLRTLLALALLAFLALGLQAYTSLGDGAFHWVFGAAFVVLIIRSAVQRRGRSRHLRDFACRMGLRYIGGALPKSFPFHRTASSQARAIGDTISGDKGQREVLVFDCALGYGKGRFRRTVVAVRGQQSGFGVARFGPDLVIERTGEWETVYSSGRLLAIEEVEALVGAV